MIYGLADRPDLSSFVEIFLQPAPNVVWIKFDLICAAPGNYCF